MEAGQGCCSYPYPLPQQPQHIPIQEQPSPVFSLPRNASPSLSGKRITGVSLSTSGFSTPSSSNTPHSRVVWLLPKQCTGHWRLLVAFEKKSLDYKSSYLVSVNRHTSVSTAAVLKGKPYLSGYHVTRFLVNTLKYHSSFFMLMGPKCFIFKQQMYFPICQD